MTLETHDFCDADATADAEFDAARYARKPPFPWFGGKSKAAPMVWALLGDVGHYVEPFAGGLAGGMNEASAKRERLWASPHCLRLETAQAQQSLFDALP